MGTQKEKEARSADSSPLLRALVLTGLCLLHCGLQWSIVQWDATWGLLLTPRVPWLDALWQALCCVCAGGGPP